MAAFADTHLLIAKTVQDGRTFTTVQALPQEEPGEGAGPYYGRGEHNANGFGQAALGIDFASKGKKMEDKKLLRLVSEIGFDMLSYGGEIYRVEETVKRICFAYGMDGVDVFAIPTTIIVSITRQDETYSRTRRLASKGTDLDKVDRLNNLSRRLWPGKAGL